jgi:hypothetical protein
LRYKAFCRDRALNFKIDAENSVERRCCGKYKVWGPAPPESRVADMIDKSIFKPVSVEQAVNGI